MRVCYLNGRTIVLGREMERLLQRRPIVDTCNHCVTERIGPQASLSYVLCKDTDVAGGGGEKEWAGCICV